MLPLAGLASGLLARILAWGAVKWVAQKALYYTLMVTILPVVLYNLFGKILNEMMTLGANQIDGSGLQSITVQLTSLAGWIGNQINIQGAIAILLSAAATKFGLRFIRRG